MRVFSQVLSLGFLALAVLFAALLVTVMATMFLSAGGIIGLGPQGGWLDAAGRMPAGYTALGDLPLREKLAYLTIAVVREGPKLAILLNQAALFRLYGRGEVFQLDQRPEAAGHGGLAGRGRRAAPRLPLRPFRPRGWSWIAAGRTSAACRRWWWAASSSSSPRS